MRPTAILKIRDSEIQRIKDDSTRVDKLEEILKKHKEYLKNERNIFINSKYFSLRKNKKRNYQISKENVKSSGLSIEENNDFSKFENVPSNKNEFKKEEKINVIGHFKDTIKTLNIDNVESEFKDYILRHFIESDHNIELELKKCTDDPDSQLIEFFFEKINSVGEDKLNKIFKNYNERISKIVDIISRTLIEMIPFFKIFTKFFDALVKNSLPLEYFKNTTFNICLQVAAKDIFLFETIFLNYGLNIILDSIKSSPIYRSEMCKLIFSIISNNEHSHNSVLQAIRKKFANSDLVVYYHILVQCMYYITEDNLDLNFEFYNNVIMRGINSNCDVIKTKSMYMIKLLVLHTPINTLDYAKKIFNHYNSWNWEILALIIIYCSKILFVLNSNREIEDKSKENFVHETITEIEKFENDLLNMVNIIFKKNNPINTLKIGFIYIADILQYYPSLAENYMKLLIEFDYSSALSYSSIRKQILEIENANEEKEYSGNCLAEKYLICGAPVLWKSIFVAQIFRDYILNNDIKEFKANHLEILYSIILHQEFIDSEAELWRDFYNDMRPYLFVSLSDKEFSDDALEICQKFFTFDKIIHYLMENTFDTFISTMKFVYDLGIIENEDENLVSPENMKILLKTISKIKIHECQIYVYRLIKTFAIQNNQLYLKSNLLELMNEISQVERGEIFEFI